MKKSGTTQLSSTRTDRDWKMIVLGVFLTVLFSFGVAVSINSSDSAASRKVRGPVKDPSVEQKSESVLEQVLGFIYKKR